MLPPELSALKVAMNGYAPISESTWLQFPAICSVKTLNKGDLWCKVGDVPTAFGFIVDGLVRSYSINAQGQEYNKNFFAEGQFPGAMTSLLTTQPSALAFETIEQTTIIEINFKGFRKLLFSNPDLMAYHIHYLEKNWVLHKDAREIHLVQNDATERYLLFCEQYPALVERLPLYHIALHLGITPTQLSRIRKSLVKNNH